VHWRHDIYKLSLKPAAACLCGGQYKSEGINILVKKRKNFAAKLCAAIKCASFIAKGQEKARRTGGRETAPRPIRAGGRLEGKALWFL